MHYQKIYFSTFSAVTIFKYEVLQYVALNSDLDIVKNVLLLLDVKRCKCKMKKQIDLPINFNIDELTRYHHQRLLVIGKFGRAVKDDIFNMGSAIKATVIDFPSYHFNLEDFKKITIEQKPWRVSDIYWKGLTQQHIDKFYKTKYSNSDLLHDIDIIKKVLGF